MGKEVVFNVPASEILKEGKMQAIGLFKNKAVTEFPDKYVITEKGIWLEEKGAFSAKAVFMLFSDFKNFAVMNGCFILYPKKGMTPTNIYFDDINGAFEIIGKYVPKLLM